MATVANPKVILAAPSKVLIIVDAFATAVE